MALETFPALEAGAGSLVSYTYDALSGAITTVTLTGGEAGIQLDVWLVGNLSTRPDFTLQAKPGLTIPFPVNNPPLTMAQIARAQATSLE